MEVYEVANIEEAVDLAYKLKDNGSYNWFRGQVRDWPPFSSLHRVFASRDSEKIEKSERRIELFFDWVGKIPELRYLQTSEHVHDFFAIMQHYGIPTHYIDFTTDPGVAGFFAADTANPPTEGKSCIYCLNTDELMSVWDLVKDLDERKGMSIELVRIDVRNLWRLQAQKGVFLFANYNWNIDYPMDRILFPYSGYPSYPTRELIYPEHKSPLEQLLDQYFSVENSTFVNEEMQQMIEELKAHGRNVAYTRWETFPKYFYAEAFIDSSHLVPLQSWSSEALQLWEFAPEEDYYQTIGSTLKLRLKPNANSEEIRKLVSFGVKQSIRSDPGIRFKTVNWEGTELPESLSEEELSDMFRTVWNGMRRLPYTNDEVADALGAVAALLMIGVTREDTSEGQRALFSQYFGECIQVEFGNLDGSSSRGLAAKKSLQRALRSDISELLALKFKEFANEIHDLFRIIYSPRLMFEFNEFKSIFAQQIIPAQVVLRRTPPILFNPARLTTFGTP